MGYPIAYYYYIKISKRRYRNMLREIKPDDIIKRTSKRYLVSNIILPSQHQSYSICTEFARDWFLEKFKESYENE